MKKITLLDVAETCGVSGATVSYILNHTNLKKFPQETIDKVRSCADRLGYEPKHLLVNGIIMVMPITPSVEQGNTIFCFDLSKDPTQLLSAPPEKIPQCEGFCKIATNRCPFVTQINLNFPGAEALVKMGIDWGECFHRYQMLRNEDSLIPKLRSLASDDEFQAVNDTDFQI